ncbi:MAG: hypothetical protein J2P41_07155, partial [Blastocatellia bacterium]|nr:hypothetical protein [Blastocatellia bacterium]
KMKGKDQQDSANLPPADVLPEAVRPSGAGIRCARDRDRDFRRDSRYSPIPHGLDCSFPNRRQRQLKIRIPRNRGRMIPLKT